MAFSAFAALVRAFLRAAAAFLASILALFAFSFSSFYF